MTERMIDVNGAAICAESVGDAGAPPILMIMGATASMAWWPDEMIRRLADAGRFVVRYDHRDTGRSTTYPPGTTPYSIDDLADDAVRVMDGFGLSQAHIVGMSLGGLIGQVLAVRDPDRVLSLTLIASEMFGDPGVAVPPMSPAILAHFAGAGGLDWNDEAAVTGFQVELAKLSAGSERPFDENRARALAIREFQRSRSPQSRLNHAGLDGAAEWFGRTSEIAAPLLVIHGTDDPVVAFGHGRALAGAVPGTKLVPLQGAGHELHPADFDTIVAAIVTHTR